MWTQACEQLHRVAFSSSSASTECVLNICSSTVQKNRQKREKKEVEKKKNIEENKKKSSKKKKHGIIAYTQTIQQFLP